MARHFGYYDDWKSAVLKCAQCGWTGTFQQGSVAHFEELIDASCPVCDTMLAIVSYPTTKESEKNWDQLTGEQKKRIPVETDVAGGMGGSLPEVSRSTSRLGGSGVYPRMGHGRQGGGTRAVVHSCPARR